MSYTMAMVTISLRSGRLVGSMAVGVGVLVALSCAPGVGVGLTGGRMAVGLAGGVSRKAGVGEGVTICPGKVGVGLAGGRMVVGLAGGDAGRVGLGVALP